MPRHAIVVPTVKVDGRRLDGRVAAGLSVLSVEQSLELPAAFTLELSRHDERDDAWFDADAPFAIGSKVELALGPMDAAPGRLIQGEITALEVEHGRGAAPRLSVRGHDLRHRLQRGRRVRTYSKMKDSAIASQIAREAGLRIEAVDSKEQLDYLIQANQTDFEFLAERAQRIGYEVAMAGETLQFRPARHLGEPELTLGWGFGELEEFRVCLASAGQLAEATVRGWDVKQKKAIVAKAQTSQVGAMGQRRGDQIAAGFGKAAELVATQPPASVVEGNAMAAALLERRMQPLLRCEGLCGGDTAVAPGIVVGIEGVGQRYSGSYYVAEARHRYDAQSGYTTRFTAWRNAL